MKDTCKFSKEGTQQIINYLYRRPDILDIVNVEDNEEYRKKDIDLLWRRLKNNVEMVHTVEIKVDNYFNSGNYFFETISNMTRNTPGCFMYSEAEYFFYYFPKKELHVISLKMVREWFIQNIEQFAIKNGCTAVGDGFYKSEGRLVPRSLVRKALPPEAVRIIPYNAQTWGDAVH